jgi:hypothetical protein
MPLDDVPPVNGPMKPTLTFSLALAGDVPSPRAMTNVAAATVATATCVNRNFRIFEFLPSFAMAGLASGLATLAVAIGFRAQTIER